MKAQILLAAAALALAGAAQAAAPADKPAKNATKNCFMSQDWQDWRGGAPDKLYFRVHTNDFYEVDLSGGGSNLVTDPTNHLISNMHGTTWICDPLDLDLKISNGAGIVEPLFVKSIRKLSREEVAAIPKKDLP